MDNKSFGIEMELTTLKLHYTKPFDFDQMLSFHRRRAISGVEVISKDSYSRTFRFDNYKGYFKITDNPEKSELILEVVSNDIRCLKPLSLKVRTMFDMDIDHIKISNHLCSDPLLLKGMKKGLVPRMPLTFNVFEFVIRAILGQQITVAAATTLAGRVAKAGCINTQNDILGLDYYFPTPNELNNLSLENLGITNIRQTTIKTVVDAILNNRLSLEKEQSFESFHKSFILLKGIGDWTINYVAMRGLGFVDAFPGKDLGVIKAMAVNDKRLSYKEILKQSEKWSPFRAYATLCLWEGL